MQLRGGGEALSQFVSSSILLNPCVICGAFPCPYFVENLPPQKHMVSKKQSKREYHFLKGSSENLRFVDRLNIHRDTQMPGVYCFKKLKTYLSGLFKVP
jgi:hypothetical protein